ncbi:MAG: M13 family metallopeptidase [Thermoanaerobaculia bacterium]
MRNITRGLVVIATVFTWNLAAQGPTATRTQPDLGSHSAGSWGIDLTDRDPSVRAEDDLYRSQNGGWLARTQLGPSQPNAAYWRDLRVLSTVRLADLVEEAAAKTSAPATIEGKAGAFYRAFMDEKTVEAKGLTPLKPELDAIRAVRTKAEMAGLMGRVEGPGSVRAPTVRFRVVHALFSLNIAQDPNDPAHYAVFVGQAGLQLPGPEYYSDPKLADLKSSYQDYIVRMLTLIGWPDAQARAADIVAFESRVAAASWSHEQMGDVVKTYNPMTLSELARFAPGFDWRAFLKGASLTKTERVIVDAKSAFPAIAKAFADAPLTVLQARQAFAAADEAAPLLNKAMVEANFDFRSKKFNSLFQSPAPRSIRAEQAVEANIVDIVSALYVSRYSSPDTKAKATEMAENLRKAFDVRLENNTWMSSATKQRARRKLAAMAIHIGYPDRFQTYEGLAIRDDDLYGNVTRAAAWNWRRSVAQLGHEFDRSEWALAPGYPQYTYLPATNAVEISAATLQPPFFDPKADDAVNYGAIGAVIGQQIVNGFDNQGGRYDASGKLADWWTVEDRKRLAAEMAKLSAQYSAVEPLPGLHVKGDLVVDEALDDIGGMLIALDAYHASLHGAPAPDLDGFTGDQRLFLGRAQMWRAKFSEGFVRNQIATGSNAPPFLRVNGPARNLDAFYQAFDVKPADKMYIAPAERVRVW